MGQMLTSPLSPGVGGGPTLAFSLPKSVSDPEQPPDYIFCG